MPERFGRYELQDLLGRGGMGEVYRAVDTVRDRTVALKLLPRHLAADENFQSRFRRESRLAARLNDPHIIPIHDFGEIDGQLFIDMRLVEGRDLGSVLADRGALPVLTAVTIVGQVASALDAAHRSGLVHRDVKPSNVLLAGWSDDADAEPFAYLVDFGIARSINQEGTALTTAGTVGTVAYLAPERIGGAPGDGRTDIYALGCMLFETLTGHQPYDGEMFAVMYAHLHSPVPRLAEYRADAPAGLDAVVAKAMAKNPADRYTGAAEFAAAARRAVRSASRPPDVAEPRSVPPAARVAPAAARFAPPAGPPAGPPAPPPDWSSAQQWPGGPRMARVAAPGPELRPAAAGPSGPVLPPHPSGPLPGRTPPPHPSGPLPTPPESPPRAAGHRRRRRMLLSLAALAVLAALATTLVAVLGRNGKPSTGGRSSGAAAPAAYATGGAGTAAVSWQHFGVFRPLVGSGDGDTAGAFRHGTCTLAGPTSTSVHGLADQVECGFPASPVHAVVARFANGGAVTNYLSGLVNIQGYGVTPFRIGNRVAGLLLLAPASAHTVDVLTYLCGLPRYLVQFYATGASQASVRSDFWAAANLTDVVPQPCNADFSGPLAGSRPAAGTVSKAVTAFPDSALPAYVRFGHPDWRVALVHVPTGSELAVVGQRGYVQFWTWDSATDQLVAAGSSRYPYDASLLGPPHAAVRGALLTDMQHATFIVTGTFSTDGSGNAVAFSSVDGRRWGAVKAQPDGNLRPTPAYVGIKGIGLSQGFDTAGGLLVTSDCSAPNGTPDCTHLIVKYWRWDAGSSEFVLDHRA